jgi:hypothetical protein
MVDENLYTGAAILGAIDYKRAFAQTYDSEDERLAAYSDCHKRSAKRVLTALLANGGAFYFCFQLYPLLELAF